MVDLTVKDVHPLSDFNRRTPEFLQQLRTDERALLLTLTGRSEVVVLNANCFQAIVNRLRDLEVQVGLANLPLSAPTRGERGRSPA